LENPLLEFLLKEKPWDDKKLEKANKLSGYYFSLNDKSDLDVENNFNIFILELLAL